MMCMRVLPAFVYHVCALPLKGEEALEPLGLESRWERALRCLQEQPVLLTAEAAPQPSRQLLYVLNNHYKVSILLFIRVTGTKDKD